MSNVAIKVENLAKKYVINHEHGNGDDNFREVIMRNTKKIITSLTPFHKSSKEDRQSTMENFWALNNVNFEIKKGDKVGIIGRNGAGKSTLLKVLSRITEPTAGKIHINGRIASLLEVGTGFHPELTGRENIYLNGAILGMSRKEIKEKFDEIVEFAEVEKFLDTPVKRYSSGMYVRLAFSVAAHLEPEILIVDEVLAVGDIEFQKKCLGKMGDVSKNGRTIIFVSHNMNAIEQLCNKGIFMKEGESEFFDDISNAILRYEDTIPKQSKKTLDMHRIDKTLSRIVEFKNVYFRNNMNKFEACKNIEFMVEIIAQESIKDIRISLTIFSSSGFAIGSTFSQGKIDLREKISKEISVSIPEPKLVSGKYYIGISVGQGNHESRNIDFDILQDVLHFDIKACDNGSKLLPFWDVGWGNIMFETLDIKES